MATKFPLEMITSLSRATNYSPVVWNGTELYVEDTLDYNLATIKNRLQTVITDFANFNDLYGVSIASISNISIEVNTLIPKITMFESQITNLNAELVDVNTLLSAYSGRISPLEIRFGDLNTNVIAIISDMSRIRTEYAKINARVEVLELNGGYLSRIATLESEMTSLGSRMDSVETRLSTAIGDIDQLSIQVNDLLSRMDAAERDVASLL